MCMQNEEKVFTPDLPPPSPPPPPKKIWLLGLDLRWVIFFQKPHICVFKMMSATTG